jgi:Na+/proline symporter
MVRFAIPFAFSTTLGLAAVALSAVPAANSSSQDPLSSNFTPLLAPLSQADISEGLPASYAAATLLGQSGAAALLVLLFLAVTSATSAELIAVSSILTYDVYVVSAPLYSKSAPE